MKKKWSRKAALLLAAVTILTSLPTEYLYAAQTQETQDTVTPEEQSNEETVVDTALTGQESVTDTEQETTETVEGTTATEETTDGTETAGKSEIETQSADTQDAVTADILVAEDLLNYLVLDNAYIAVGGTQNVVANIGNEDLVIGGGRLLYHRVSDGAAYEMAATETDGNGLRFSETFADESRTGEYALDAIIYEKDGQEYQINLSDAGMDVRFGVNTEVETNPDAEVVDEATTDVDMDVVSFDENGNQTSEDSIADAIENQKEDTSDTGVSRTRYNGNVVVVLDPGHDGTHGGSSANGFVEAQLNLKIAQYCKAELEQYRGVTVYMTRDSSSCPNGGGDNKSCLQRRANIARDMGASLFVSLHNNYSSSPSASGAEIWYPNQNYNSWTSQVGGSAASKILEQLTSLGLHNRGTQIRSANQDKYPDGSAADYYAVIRHTKEYGIPGIIVEHAFMSNASDATNFLSNDEQLKRLGVADATGIANYFELTKEPDYGFGTAKVTSTWNKEKKVYTVEAKGIENAAGVKYAVWSLDNGQDDLKWYSAQKNDSGNWIATVPLSNHNSVGTYAVHTYVVRRNGSQYVVAQNTWDVSDEISATVTVKNINTVTGCFDVIVSNIDTTFEVKSVQVPVWSKGNQSDIKWYLAEKQKDGTYKVHVDIANHNCNFGTYQVHTYITDNSNTQKNVNTTAVNIPKPVTTVTANVNSGMSETYVSAWHVPGTFGASLKSVQFAVWSNEDGQDDLKWYTASASEDKYIYTIPLINHKSTGIYIVHVYANMANGTRQFVGSTNFTVSNAKADSVEIQNVNTVTGCFDVVVSGTSAANGINQVQVPVWSKKDQSDIKWYIATKQRDGSYKTHVDVANHNCNFAIYQVDTYIKNGYGSLEKISGTSVNLNSPATVIDAKVNDTQTAANVTAWHIPGTFGKSLQKVRFAVWSAENGQDDLVWYTATLSGDKYVCDVPIGNHRSAGTYYVHLYAEYSNGVNKYLGNTSFDIEQTSISNVTIKNLNTVSGVFDVIVSGIKAPAGVKKVEVPVWSKADQSDIKWYLAEKQKDGTYKAHVDIVNHNCNFGTYQIHTYVTDGMKNRKKVNATAIKITKPVTTVSASANNENTEYNVTAWHVPGTIGKSLKSVQFAVWSEENGQDDLKWYTANMHEDKYVYSVPVSNHKTTGIYYVHVYANYSNGTKEKVGETTFKVTGPSAASISVVNKDEMAGTFQVKVSGVTSAANIKKVEIPVWSQANQSDIVWYTATKIGDGTYVAYVDIRNHKNNLGKYQIHVYVEDEAGFFANVGRTDTQVLKTSNSYYSIVGSSVITASQLARYYTANASYPDYYATTDAPTLEEFCKIYVEECNAEGIKVEVAFAQAMKETGYLRFSGRVPITALNFSGLGAIDSNASAYATFSSVREGIRAQVQHLKAYASTEVLNNPCVDPRFSLVTRGSAPYVEWLGIQENPYGKGWATAKNYGYSVKNDYIAKLLQY